jgi:carboxypeptidase Q
MNWHFWGKQAVVGLLLVGALAAQQKPERLPPLSPSAPPGVPVPVGTGGCSATAPTCAEVTPQLVRAVEGSPWLERNLEILTDDIGGRVTGSPQLERATEWAVRAFEQAGVDRVWTEPFTVPSGWSAGAARVTLLEQTGLPVRLVATGWSPPTPPEGITAELLDAGRGTAEDFQRLGERVRGSVVLIHSKLLESWEDLFAEYLEGPAIVARAHQAGAQAILWMSSRPYLLLYRHTLQLDGRPAPLPQAIVAREDALRLVRLLQQGRRLHVRLEMANRLGPAFTARNVVAEIRGREKPDEFVLLGAHLDSWDLGTGALDNGCNVALVLEVARAMHAVGVRPRRSVRFVLFTGEEQGMLGSWAYARQHRQELDRLAAVVVFDAGSGAVTGYELSGRDDLLPALQATLQPAAFYGPLRHSLDVEIGTDNFDFFLEGVPTLVAAQQPANYLINYHAFSDTFEKVDLKQLRKNTALAAVTVYALADREQALGRRLSRREVEALLERTGAAAQMRQMGLWAAWERGERGR